MLTEPQPIRDLQPFRHPREVCDRPAGGGNGQKTADK